MNRKKGFFLVFALAYLYEHIRAIDNVMSRTIRHATTFSSKDVNISSKWL